MTDGRTARGRVRAIALPRWAQPPVRYQACVVRRRGGDGAGANAFLRRLRATAGRRVLKPAGSGSAAGLMPDAAAVRGAGFTALLALAAAVALTFLALPLVAL